MPQSNRLNMAQSLIVILTIATAIIHVALGFGFNNPLFILNGIGYAGLLGLLFLPIAQLAAYRGTVRWVLLGYTALTFVLYFVFNWPDIWGPLGLIDKAIELVLMVLLVRQTRA